MSKTKTVGNASVSFGINFCACCYRRMVNDRKERTMQTKILMMSVAVMMAVATCCVLGDESKTTQGVPTNAVVVAVAAPKLDKPFDIPPSLIHRMEEAFNALRKRLLRTNIDVQELFVSDGKGGKFPNAHLIAARPRGEMKFCKDCMNEKEREELWPFDVEGFEKSLEAKMVRDKDGRFRLTGVFAQEAGPTNDDGYVAPHPTIRWANHEIEQWAIKQLDGKFKRMDNAAFCKMSGDESLSDGTFAWKLSDVCEFFVIYRCEGEWNRREYRYIVKGEEMKRGVPVATFDSFPNRKEAAAMRTYGRNAAAFNNLAVLEWQHRNHRLSMIPERIKWFLETAKEQGVLTADENMKVLRDHIPEVFKE